jgi:hypothetical protein
MGQVGKEKEMKLFKDFKKVVLNEPEIDYLIDATHKYFLQIEADILEQIKNLREVGADNTTIEWKIIKILQKYGVPISKRDFFKQHPEIKRFK